VRLRDNDLLFKPGLNDAGERYPFFRAVECVSSKSLASRGCEGYIQPAACIEISDTTIDDGYSTRLLTNAEMPP